MTYSLGDNQDPDYTAPRGLRRYVTQLIGCVILAAGVGFMVLLGTYSPFDANWFAATGNPPENLLGGFGASVAGVLMLSIGWASWTIPVVLIAWGLRFLAMRGNETAFTRFIAIPFLLFVGATFAAVHTPPTGWPHDFGLGGLAGDATLDLLLAYLPADLRTNLVIVSLGLAGTSALLLLIATGVTFREVYWFFDMSIWSLGAVFNVLGRAFGGGSSTPKTPSKKTVRKEKAIKKRLEEEAPPKVTSDKQEIDPFESRISSDEIDEPILIDRSERQSDIISRVAERALAKPKTAKKGRTFVKPKGQASFKAGAGEGPKSGLKAMFKKPSPQTTMDIPENTEPARSTDQIVDPNESLEDRLKRKISDAIQERIQETEELSAAEEEQLREDVAIQVEEEMAEEEQLREDVAIQEEDDLVEEELEANVFAEAPEVIATSNGVPEPAPRRSLFERGENLFSSFGRARKARAEPLIREKAEPPVQADPSLMSEDRTNIIEYPKPKKQQQSRKAKKEEQPELFEESAEGFTLPPFSLLATPVKIDRASLSDDALAENAKLLETVLDDYGVKGEIVSVRPGPVVTMYELEPAPGLKASRVIGLADDIARSMSALSARVSTVPGRTVIGIELPNEQRETVYLREILSGRDYGDGKYALPLALGKDIGGSSIVADLAKMPHLLIAGTTGSGKSVAINTMILSLAYKLSPDECRMIMIDPKMLELSVYDGIPHLLSPVVTDPKKAVVALKWVVGEMEERYRKMSKMGVRNIGGYNSRVQEALDKGEDFERTVQTGFDDTTGNPIFETETFKPEKLPFIVVVVDEMADLMMVAGKEIEACIQRLAQMARASGIHLIMATQRPSVDVITGTIKANFPTRISFQVTSKVDSRTILGEMGAEQLLGMGDMLYMAGGGKITRIHGPFASDKEVEDVANHLRKFGPPEYVGSVVEGPRDETETKIDEVLGLGGNTGKEDALYDEAVAIVARDRKASTSYIQRRLSIGYNKAARLMEQMEENGVVSPANHVGKREVLVPEQD